MDTDLLFSPNPATRQVARELYQGIATLPLVCPHGHVDERLFSDPSATFGSPAELLIIPDHYVTRMMYSQGLPLEIFRRAACGWRRQRPNRPSQILAKLL